VSEATERSGVDWPVWLSRWDAQQTGYIAEREARFAAMFDGLEVLLPPEFVAVDRGCGPGSLARRLLDRFPGARCVAVDLDPVLLTLGQRVHRSVGGRLTWIETDLREPDWPRSLPTERLDAVLSTTALHWLPSDGLARLYRALGTLLGEGGVFLNGDTLRFGPAMPAFRRLIAAIEQRDRGRVHGRPGAEDWESWWLAFEREPGLAELFAERRRRFAWRLLEPGKRYSAQPSDGASSPIIDFHEAALRNAGFREVGVIWQRVDDRVLLAVR
jgi:SAM-dependent methyltransferase